MLNILYIKSVLGVVFLVWIKIVVILVSYLGRLELKVNSVGARMDIMMMGWVLNASNGKVYLYV